VFIPICSHGYLEPEALIPFEGEPESHVGASLIVFFSQCLVLSSADSGGGKKIPTERFPSVEVLLQSPVDFRTKFS